MKWRATIRVKVDGELGLADPLLERLFRAQLLEGSRVDGTDLLVEFAAEVGVAPCEWTSLRAVAAMTAMPIRRPARSDGLRGLDSEGGNRLLLGRPRHRCGPPASPLRKDGGRRPEALEPARRWGLPAFPRSSVEFQCRFPEEAAAFPRI